MRYIDLDYTPREDDLLVFYYFEPADGISKEEAVEAIAGESSIGTWTDVITMKEEIKLKLKPCVYELKNNHVKIAYSSELFEKGNIPQILSSIAGNIFGMKAVKNLRLIDVRFPPEILDSMPGPYFGIQGVRDVFKVKDRPLVGTIVKPKVGLDEKEFAEVVYNALSGGCDFVKDDENLTNMSFNEFKKRVKLSLEMAKRAEEETGEKKAYLPNITAPYKEMLKRAEYVKNLDGKYIMIDVVTAGFSALQSIREENFGMIIHAHRAMYAAFARNKKHGISTLAFSKLVRLAGADQLHIGTVVGKMEGEKREILAIQEEMKSNEFEGNEMFFPQEWRKIKPLFPVASGGLHPFLIPELYLLFGKDIIMMFGGGVHGHPKGSTAGARTVRMILDAVIKNKDIKTVVQKEEVRIAYEKWGKKRWEGSS